jgi:hypothetical protein
VHWRPRARAQILSPSEPHYITFLVSLAFILRRNGKSSQLQPDSGVNVPYS